jgi:hypothetical protein
MKGAVSSQTEGQEKLSETIEVNSRWPQRTGKFSPQAGFKSMLVQFAKLRRMAI